MTDLNLFNVGLLLIEIGVSSSYLPSLRKVRLADRPTGFLS